MRRIPTDTPNPPLGATHGLRGGDRGGAQARPLHANAVVDDEIRIGAEGADWDSTPYTDKNTGEKRVRMTRRN